MAKSCVVYDLRISVRKIISQMRENARCDQCCQHNAFFIGIFFLFLAVSVCIRLANSHKFIIYFISQFSFARSQIVCVCELDIFFLTSS